MEVNKIYEGKNQKTFLFVCTRGGLYDVRKIVCSDDEIKTGFDEAFGVNDESYSLYTTSEYIGDRKIADIEVGEILDLEYGEKLIRLA